MATVARLYPGAGKDWRRAITHCPQGHAYDEDNTLWNGEGWRYCRECNRAAARAYQRRRRDAA